MSTLKRQSGAALLLVLVVLALISSLVYSNLDQQRFLMRKVGFAEGAQQARVAALTALEKVKLTLVLDGQIGTIDHLGEMWAVPVPVDTPGAVTYFQIEDSARRWNVNRLVSDEGKIQPQLAALLETSFLSHEQEPDVLGELIDWIDTDDTWSLYGTGREALDYESEGYEYGPRNSYMQDSKELSFLPLWQARDELEPVITASSACPDASLNLNTASRAALGALDGILTDYQIDSLLSERENEAFKSLDDALARIDLPDLDVSHRKLLSVSSGCFDAVVVSQVGDVRVRMKLHLKRSKAGSNKAPQVRITRLVWD